MCKGRQIVACGMTPQQPGRLFPSAWRRRTVGVEPEGLAEIIEHTVSVKEQQVMEAAPLVIIEYSAASEPKLFHGSRL